MFYSGVFSIEIRAAELDITTNGVYSIEIRAAELIFPLRTSARYGAVLLVRR